MAKFVDLEHIKSVLNDYPSSSSNKILSAIEEEFIYDENDIRSPQSIVSTIIIGGLLALFYLGLTQLPCHF